MQPIDDEPDTRDCDELLKQSIDRAKMLIAKIQHERDNLAERAQADGALRPGVELMDNSLAAAERMLASLHGAAKVAPARHGAGFES